MAGAIAPPTDAMMLWLIAGYLSLQPLSTDLYLASLPHLATRFAVTPAVVQQTLTLFVVGFGLAQLVSGPMSDRYGRRPVLLGGFLVYFLASAICLTAPTMGVLIAGRVAQALGCCSVVVVARALVRDAYSAEEGAHVIARASMILGCVAVSGPIVGSYLQVWFGWRAAFALLASLSLALGVISWRRLAETNLTPNPHAMRPRGLFRAYLGVLRAPAFWAYALPGAGSYAAIFCFISGSAFVLIDVLGVPTQYYGYCFAFGVLGYLLGTLFCRRLLQRRGLPATLPTGAMLAAAGGSGLLAATLAGWRHWGLLLAGQFVVMFAHGLNQPCALAGAIAPFKHEAGAAAGLLGFLMMAAALVVGTWMGASHDGTVRPLAFAAAVAGAAILGSALATRRYLVPGQT